MHIFDIYRRILVLLCGVYSFAKIVQAISVLLGKPKSQSAVSRLARSYLLTMLATVQLSRFRGEILKIMALLALLLLIVFSHGYVMELW